MRFFAQKMRSPKILHRLKGTIKHESSIVVQGQGQNLENACIRRGQSHELRKPGTKRRPFLIFQKMDRKKPKILKKSA